MKAREVVEKIKCNIGLEFNTENVTSIIQQYEKERFKNEILILEEDEKLVWIKGSGWCTRYTLYKDNDNSDIFVVYVDSSNKVVDATMW